VLGEGRTSWQVKGISWGDTQMGERTAAKGARAEEEDIMRESQGTGEAPMPWKLTRLPNAPKWSPACQAPRSGPHWRQSTGTPTLQSRTSKSTSSIGLVWRRSPSARRCCRRLVGTLSRPLVASWTHSRTVSFATTSLYSG